jgi:hypothetical protein
MTEGEVPEEPKDEAQSTEYLKKAANTLWPLAVSAIVSVGFVAFAGKAVLWTRFQALQVPADQVVRVVPQSEAVATGASMLLVFGLFGVLSALGVYLIDRGGRPTPGMSRGLLAILAVEAVLAIWLTDGKPVELRVLASEVVLLAIGTIFWSTFVSGLAALDQEVPNLKEEDEEQQELKSGPFFRTDNELGVAKGPLCAAIAISVVAGAAALGLTLLVGGSSRLAWAIGVGVLGLVLLAAALGRWHRFVQEKKKAAKKKKEDDEREKKEKERKQATLPARCAAMWKALCGSSKGSPGVVTAPSPQPPDGGKRDADGDGDPDREKPRGMRLRTAGLVLATVLSAMAIAIPSVLLREWWLAVSLGTAALLGAALWRVAMLAEKRFVWYGLAMFISVPLFGTVMLMARNVDEPKVQPMALIRSTDGPDESIQGLYVTETSDRVYFANVATEGCEKKVTPHSGRLLWVPKSEVVAMAIGPLQNVEQAGKSALEMSYALTPGIETGSATIDLPEPAPAPEGDEGGGEEKEEKEEATGNDTRLKNVGPAVRPNFGTGLRIEPEVVSPGAEATLRMSHENAAVEGFGSSRAGHNLRLGGKVVDISKEPAEAAEGAEYIETENGRLIALAKKGSYVEVERGKFVPEEAADGDDQPGGEGPFVRLDDPAVLEVGGEAVSEEEPAYVRVEKDSKGRLKVAPGAKVVTLAGGVFEGHSWELEKGVALAEQPLLRQAWHSDHIRFHVPAEAHSSVVSVECDQLAGAPLLQVSHSPTARLEVHTSPRSTKVFFDSSRSSDEDEGEEIKRHWKIDGVRAGRTERIHSWMPPGRALHRIELTVTDKAGNSDTATLLMLRLPTPGFGVGIKESRTKHAIVADRKAIDEAVEAERPKEIELDGYTDTPGRAAANLRRALGEDRKARRNLLPEPDEFPQGERAIPIAELAHGASCLIYPASGPRPVDRHVDLFVLNEDVIVNPAKGCHARSQQSAKWHPPSTSKTLASISSVPSTPASPSP